MLLHALPQPRAPRAQLRRLARVSALAPGLFAGPVGALHASPALENIYASGAAPRVAAAEIVALSEMGAVLRIAASEQHARGMLAVRSELSAGARWLPGGPRRA